MTSWLPSWLWSSSSVPDGPPDRASRVRCWDARDQFFACLDKNDILDALKEDDKASKLCGTELKGFDQNCAASWVKYFKQRRVAEHDKAKLLAKQQAEMFKD
jgi:cytochrome c oxidase assembly factor 6